MSSSESTTLKVPKFDGKNFNFCKSKIENCLMFMELNDFLSTKAEGENIKKDMKALAFIKESLSDSLFRQYNQTSTKELWDKLKPDFETVTSE